MKLIRFVKFDEFITRKHSSRMRTARFPSSRGLPNPLDADPPCEQTTSPYPP